MSTDSSEPERKTVVMPKPELSHHQVNDVTDEVREQMVRNATVTCQQLLTDLLIDWRNDPNCRETPARMARMFVNELFVGRLTTLPVDMTAFPESVKQPLFVGPIKIKSTCAHHFLPIVGHAWIGCLPNPDSVIGLSKYARIVGHCMRRPTMQEMLTKAIAVACVNSFNPLWIGVSIEAVHLCMCHRGVEEDGSRMRTYVEGGLLTKQAINVSNETIARKEQIDEYGRRLAQFQASCPG